MRGASILVVACLTLLVNADVEWTPSGNSPLPLSKKYRDNLRRLCEMRKSGEASPMISKMSESEVSRLDANCNQLMLEEQSGSPGTTFTWVGLFVFLGAIMYAFRVVFPQSISFTRSTNMRSSQQQDAEARAARVARFAGGASAAREKAD